MKPSTWTLLAVALSNLAPIESYADERSLFVRGDWNFEYVEGAENDAAICALSVSARPNPSSEVLHIQASPGTPIVAFTRGGLSKGYTVSWEVDGMQAAHFEIGEEQAMTPIGLRTLSALSAGKRLLYYVNDEYADAFPLNGSSAAIDKFMECWTGSTNPTKANRVVGFSFLSGTYNDLAILGNKQTSVASAVRRDVYEKGLSAYFVGVADDGEVVTKGYKFFFLDTEKVGRLVAVATLTSNTAGEVETEVDEELAGSCVERESSILCYGIGYGQREEYRLDFDKASQPYIGEDAKQEVTAALTKDENDPSQKSAAEPVDEKNVGEMSELESRSEKYDQYMDESNGSIPERNDKYRGSDENIDVESFGVFKNIKLKDVDFTDVGGKKIRRAFNNFVRPARREFLYEFGIKDRFRPLSSASHSVVKFSLDNIREEDGSVRSTIVDIHITRGVPGRPNYSHNYFKVEQGDCVENAPLDAETREVKTVHCKGISTDGERFEFLFEVDMEFPPKITKSSAGEEMRLADEEEERSRRETEYLRCLVAKGNLESCEHLKN